MNNIVDNLDIEMHVYVDDGRVFSYIVSGEDKAREHCSAIIMTGYRHTTKDGLEHIPPHRISKVKCIGNMGTLYPDSVRGT